MPGHGHVGPQRHVTRPIDVCTNVGVFVGEIAYASAKMATIAYVQSTKAGITLSVIQRSKFMESAIRYCHFKNMFVLD